LAKAETTGVRILLPSDLVVADDSKAEAGSVVESGQVPDGQAAFDIGPRTVGEMSAVVSRARTVFWNGPMGVFESPAFTAGTLAVAKALALVMGGTTVVAGGDSAAAAERAGVASTITHVSTGGGASLAFIEGKKLPGFAALET
jgi:phosphoglycerate kinase